MQQIIFGFDAKGNPFVPFWKKLITAGRAAEGLREDWRIQFRELQREIGFEYIRFHGLLHDDMMVYREWENGSPFYYWQYIDNLFDFLLSTGCRPFIELSFMPKALATGDKTASWWKGNITPPKDYSKWEELVRRLVVHCVNRYGIEEVRQWYFEVWNEPDLHNHFWAGSQR
jgi:xylan 1,4-beta-xylosidase